MKYTLWISIWYKGICTYTHTYVCGYVYQKKLNQTIKYVIFTGKKN